MIRRNARLRKEYLYRKSLQHEERERLERKMKIREALEQGKPVSKDILEAEARESVYGISGNENVEEKEKTTEAKNIAEVDDEYATAGQTDPKVLLTTSHSPSSRLSRFIKEMKLIFPKSTRMNRGELSVSKIIETGKTGGFSDIIIFTEQRGEPNGMIISHLPYGPTAYFNLLNVVMRHDVGATEPMSEAFPHLILHNLKTKLGLRVGTILKYLFPIPKDESRRIMTFANDNDFISFRHHVYKKEGKKVKLKEVGPRFEMKLYQIKLGTLDMPQAQNEWVLRPYMNTAAKRQALGVSKEEKEMERHDDVYNN
eukprot:gb/GECH01013256.1/.p1 GENE.gb/GECH01013256.1/~~gb/GECH01013256.1/.p1  ORF type:complete len:313 (+),score=99.15 gb/GECH01013256.1/:1-939(+)